MRTQILASTKIGFKKSNWYQMKDLNTLTINEVFVN